MGFCVGYDRGAAHKITTVYSGDDNFNPDQSPVLRQKVKS
jgi:hypothetical protein